MSSSPDNLVTNPSMLHPSDKPAAATIVRTDQPEPADPVSVWAIHRRMYNWVLSLSHKRHATPALFGLSFAESSVFPIPPDVLQIALTLERREKAFFYAAVSTAGSVLGGMLGYLIGFAFWSALAGFFLTYVFKQDAFDRVGALYEQYNFWCVFIAAFTPIPYKVFTIAAGVFSISFPMFVIASMIGRGLRFFIVAGLLHKFGPPIKVFIEKYFNLLSLVFVVLLVGAFALLKLLK